MMTLSYEDMCTLTGLFIGAFGVGFSFGFFLRAFRNGVEKASS